MKEVALLLTLIGLTVAAPPPDDDMSRSEKNFYRFTQKVINRFVSELRFFYDPSEWENIVGGNAFPAIGIFKDVTRFISHTTMELTGMDISDPEKTYDEVVRDARPLKYGARLFPITKELLNYFAMFDDQFAKDFDITIADKNY